MGPSEQSALLLIHSRMENAFFLPILRVSKRLAYIFNGISRKFKMIQRKTRSAAISRQDCHFDNFEVLHNSEKTHIFYGCSCSQQAQLVIQAVNQGSKFKRNEQKQRQGGFQLVDLISTFNIRIGTGSRQLAFVLSQALQKELDPVDI